MTNGSAVTGLCYALAGSDGWPCWLHGQSARHAAQFKIASVSDNQADHIGQNLFCWTSVIICTESSILFGVTGSHWQHPMLALTWMNWNRIQCNWNQSTFEQSSCMCCTRTTRQYKMLWTCTKIRFYARHILWVLMGLIGHVPLHKGNLSYQATFLWQRTWPYKRGTTVLVIQLLLGTISTPRKAF